MSCRGSLDRYSFEASGEEGNPTTGEHGKQRRQNNATFLWAQDRREAIYHCNTQTTKEEYIIYNRH